MFTENFSIWSMWMTLSVPNGTPILQIVTEVGISYSSVQRTVGKQVFQNFRVGGL
jgi:hypothetical protein